MGTVIHPLLALIAALVQLGPSLVGPSTSPAEQWVLGSTPTVVEFVDMPDDFVTSVNWAIDLFEQADLALPPLRFVHHGDDRTPCGGYFGVHENTEHRSVIGLCTTECGGVTDLLILHELSDAWLEHNLSDARKEDFKTLRAFDHWRNREEVAWHENGCGKPRRSWCGAWSTAPSAS